MVYHKYFELRGADVTMDLTYEIVLHSCTHWTKLKVGQDYAFSGLPSAGNILPPTLMLGRGKIVS
jgi:hypothetical protein